MYWYIIYMYNYINKNGINFSSEAYLLICLFSSTLTDQVNNDDHVVKPDLLVSNFPQSNNTQLILLLCKLKRDLSFD